MIKRKYNKNYLPIFVLKKQRGITIVIVMLISATFMLVIGTILFISTVNSQNVRRDVQITKANIASDSGIRSALEKVKRYMMASSVVKFKPELNFGYTEPQMAKIDTLPATASIDEITSALNSSASTYLNADASGTLPFDKRLTGESFDPRKNYYTFSTKGNDNRTINVRYRIEDDIWRAADKNTAVKKLTVYSVSNSDGTNNWRGIKSNILITRSNLFSYGVFFNDDLEILPGAPMTFKGKVHTNKNMYLGPNLTFGSSTGSSSVSSAGHIYFGRKNDDTYSGSTTIYNTNGTAQTFNQDTDSINTSKLKTFHSYNLENEALGDNNPSSPNTNATWKVASSSDDSSKWNTSTVGGKKWDWSKDALTRWGGAVQDSSHGVEKKSPPSVDDIQPGGLYEQKAGLVIKTDKTNLANGAFTETISVKDKTGVVLYQKTLSYSSATATPVVTSAVNNLGITTSAKAGINPAIKADPFDSVAFVNGREAKTVRNTSVDIASLQKSPYWPESGLIYASRNDSVAAVKDANGNITNESSRNPSGIMLTNGSKLTQSLNFVTNNPVYVKGDFNKHQTNDGTSISDTSSDMATSTDLWQPSSIISDATTLLSNSFDPTSSAYASGTGKSPTVASNTEFNFTMVTGNVPTKRTTDTEDNYSGGLENFPRFLENWSGKEVKMRGSFVQLWQSKYATSPWKTSGSSYYSAPNRNWGYDESYNKVNLPDTFTDMFPSVTEQIAIQDWRYLESSDPLLNPSSTRSMVK